jgi:hypothetical protein
MNAFTYKDRIGKTIKVGDFVAYAVGSQQDTGVYFGTIEKIRTDGTYQRDNGPIIRPYPDGRLMNRPRCGDEVIILEKFREQNAEAFI